MSDKIDWQKPAFKINQF